MEQITKRLGLVVVAIGLMIGSSQQASAGILLDLEDPAFQTNTPYSFLITATDVTTTVSFAGYQLPAFEFATSIGVFAGGVGSNLLGSTWDFTAASSGSFSAQYSDGSGVNALEFGCVVEDNFDTYSQTFATTIGSSYTLNFLFSNDSSNSPSGFTVSTSGGTAVPEPSSLVLTGIAGLMGLGFARLRRKRAVLA